MIQAVSLVGAALVLGAFGGRQLGRLSADSAVYQIMNLAGALILAGVAILGRVWGFVLLNGVWATVSLIALVRLERRRAAGIGHASAADKDRLTRVE